VSGEGFPAQPQTTDEMLRAVLMRLERIDLQVSRTNGRVTRLERFAWAAGGGLAVVSAVVVPLFVRMVAS
jgi:hypothetical protein